MNEESELSVMQRFQPNIGPIAISLDITMTAIAIFSVVGRFYSRATILSTLKSDDWVIFLAVVLDLIKTILVPNLVVISGYGRHDSHVSPEEMRAANRVINKVASQYLTIGSVIACSLVRTSILLFFGHINPYKRIQHAVWAGLIKNNAHVITWLCFIIFRCSDLQWSFTSGDPPPGVTCLNGLVWNLALTAAAIVLDVYCWCIPAFLFYHLRSSIMKRIQVHVLLSLGLLVVVAGIVRFALMHELLNSKVDIRLEPIFGIIAACLPGNKPLFDRAAERISGWLRNPRINGNTDILELQSIARRSVYDLEAYRSRSNEMHGMSTHTHLDDDSLAGITQSNVVVCMSTTGQQKTTDDWFTVRPDHEYFGAPNPPVSPAKERGGEGWDGARDSVGGEAGENVGPGFGENGVEGRKVHKLAHGVVGHPQSLARM